MSKETLPLVTIGISFFNPGLFLIDAIKSVFAQSYDNWELIIIDDGSTENISDTVSKIKDTRVTFKKFDRRKGLAFRLNQIIKMAQGDLIARMDADDMMHPNRIHKQVMFLEKQKLIDALDTEAVLIDLDSNPVGFFKKSLTKGHSASDVLRHGGFLHPAIMARRNWYKNNLYDPSSDFKRAEDRELWARTFSKAKMAHLHEPLYFYRFLNNVRTEDYLQSYKSERKIIIKYGPGMVGPLQSCLLYIRSSIKTGALGFLSFLHQEQMINRFKIKPIDEKDKRRISSIIKQIKVQPIPGIDAGSSPKPL